MASEAERQRLRDYINEYGDLYTSDAMRKKLIDSGAESAAVEEAIQEYDAKRPRRTFSPRIAIIAGLLFSLVTGVFLFQPFFFARDMAVVLLAAFIGLVVWVALSYRGESVGRISLGCLLASVFGVIFLIVLLFSTCLIFPSSI